MSDRDDTPHPAEARAAELLALLSTWPPDAGPEFATALVARARAQGAVAAPLRVLGGFLLALAAAGGAAAQVSSTEHRS
jgi:hypothetical protein